MHEKDHTSCSSGIYSANASLAQYPQIHKRDRPHKQNIGEKSHDHGGSVGRSMRIKKKVKSHIHINR